MEAIVIHSFGGPEVLTLEELEELSPAPDQILVEIRAAGVNPVDTYLRAGTQGYSRSLPFTPGADGAGVVLSVGDGVRFEGRPPVAVADRVYVAGSVSGTYAQQCLCMADQVFPLPETDRAGRDIGFAEGAALWINYGTAYRALFQRGEAVPGDWVLVHGATGGVGVAAIQWAHGRGLRVIGSAGSDRGEKLLSQMGVDLVLSHHDDQRAERVMEATAGRGAELIVEMLANANLERDMEMIAPGGRIVVVGSRGSIEVTPRLIMGKEADVRGLILGGASGPERAEIHAAIRNGLSDGSLRPVIQELLPLAEAPEAHRSVMQDRSHGKIILEP